MPITPSERGGKEQSLREMYVCLLLQYLVQICSRGGRGIVEDSHALAEASVDVVVYYCST